MACAGVEEGEYGVDAPVLACVGWEVEFAEDAAYVCFDRLAGDIEVLGDAAVGFALGDQREYFALARCELGDAATTQLWRQVGGPDRAGRGVVIGVIDTGVWPDNPSLAGPPGQRGQDRSAPIPGSAGSARPGPGGPSPPAAPRSSPRATSCAASVASNVATSDYLSPRDGSGHGTSVAAIAAGNAGVDTRIGRQDFGHISGQAPAAALSIYKACWTAPDPAQDGCDVADTVKAIDQAVADGVDVINYSIGDPSSTLADPVQLAFLGAAAATSSWPRRRATADRQRQRPAPRSRGSRPPAPTREDVFEGGVRLGDGQTLVGAMLSNRRVGPAPLVYARRRSRHGETVRRAAALLPRQPGRPAGRRGDRGVRPGGDVPGEQERRRRPGGWAGDGPRQHDAGQRRRRSASGPDRPSGRSGRRPASRPTSRARVTHATATIEPTATNHPEVPVVADFSGAGPSEVAGGDVLKPDLTAPGVSVIAAVAPTDGPEQFWDVRSGTSIVGAPGGRRGGRGQSRPPDLEPGGREVGDADDRAAAARGRTAR